MNVFLAPTGAQETLISVYLLGSDLSRAVNLNRSGSNLQAISQESVSSQGALRASKSKSIQSKPKNTASC